jgi:hypothetical protein
MSNFDIESYRKKLQQRIEEETRILKFLLDYDMDYDSQQRHIGRIDAYKHALKLIELA